jgi:hypothetical protein
MLVTSRLPIMQADKDPPPNELKLSNTFSGLCFYAFFSLLLHDFCARPCGMVLLALEVLQKYLYIFCFAHCSIVRHGC